MSLEDWAVDVEKEVNNMEDMSKALELKRKRCIYRIPDYISVVDNKACKPQVVSFGPYHHFEQNLEPMEEHKNRALLHFLKRSKKPLRPYLDALAQEVKDLKDAYAQLDPWWLEDDEDFLQLMIIDGCFTLEILRVGCHRFENDYAYDDPIFSTHAKLNTMSLIRRDMLLLENQVPLRVLEIILDVERGDMMAGEFLIKCILESFCTPSRTRSRSRSQSIVDGLHVLDVCRRGHLVEQPPMVRRRRRRRKPIILLYDINIPSATELHEAGIRFRTSKTTSLKDITFKLKYMTLYFPPIVFKDDTKSFLLNLMAFERLHVGAGNEVTSYVFFMGCLIKSGRDASLLRSLGFVHTALGTDEDVADIFRLMDKDANNYFDPADYAFVKVHYKLTQKMTNYFRFRAWGMGLLGI